MHSSDVYPECFKKLVESFKILPGIGDKSAERFVYALKDKEYEDIVSFSKNLIHFREKIKKCNACGVITELEMCDICSSNTRNNSTLCVVQDSKSVFAIERTRSFDGKYYVLNGLISPLDNVNPEDLELGKLIELVDRNETKEIIIALSPSMEGEITSLYLRKIIEGKNVKVSRLSYGLPIGSDIEYLDPIMMGKALEDRKYIINE